MQSPERLSKRSKNQSSTKSLIIKNQDSAFTGKANLMSSELVKRSLRVVKERAAHQRKSPERLPQVESKVAANVEIREKIHQTARKQARHDEKFNSSIPRQNGNESQPSDWFLNLQQDKNLIDENVPMQPLRSDSPGVARLEARQQQIEE